MDETKVKKLFKDALKNEIAPLLIGLRNEIEKATSTQVQVLERVNTTLDTKEMSVVDFVEFLKGKPGYTPQKGVDYFTEDETKLFLQSVTPKKGHDYFTAIEATEFKDACTPRKGVDYFDGITPVKGTDYFTDEEATAFLKSITPIKGIHYRDGTDGAPGEKGADGTKITAEDIRNKLESLTGKARLSIKAIKGLEEKLADHFKEFSGGKSSNQGGGIGAGTDVGRTYLTAGTNVTITGTGTQANPYIISSSGGGGGSYTFSTGLTDTASTITANLSTGKAGGQSVIGGVATSENLTLSSTAHATKGSIIFGTSSYNEVANTLGIGTTASTLHKLVMADTVLAGSGSLAGSLINMTQTWNTTGAPTAIKLNVTNTASGAATLLMDLQVGSVSQFKVSKAGTATQMASQFGTSVYGARLFPFTTAPTVPNTAGTNLTFYNSTINAAASGGAFAFTGESMTQTSGTVYAVTIPQYFTPTSGTATYAALGITGNITQTGGANGITRGIYVNPNLSTVVDYRAVDVANTSGYGIYQSGASALNYFAGNTGIGTTASSTDRLMIADTTLAGSGSLAGSLISGTQTWNTSGNPTAIKLNITNTASGAAALLMDLQIGGVSQFKVDKAGVGTFAGALSTGGAITTSFNVSGNSWLGSTLVRSGATSGFQWNGRSFMASPADGQITFSNGALTDFTRLNLGGTTSSFPSIKRNGTAINFRLADDSADADITLKGFTATGKGTFNATMTAGGTTGNQTINKPAGSVNIAAAGTTVTVTNSFVTASSIIHCVVMTNDTTALIKNVVPSSGSFVITMNAAVTAETKIGFIVYN